MNALKQILFLICITSIISSLSFAQTEKMQRGEGRKHFRGSEKIRELEKIKLIETLNLDEQTTLKFFARRNEHLNKVEDLRRQHAAKLNQMQKMLVRENGQDYNEIVKKTIEIEKELEREKNNFHNSLTDILNYEQIAKYLVFERNFRRELREQLMNFRRSNKK